MCEVSATAVKIRHLYISPGHNYFGRHGLTPGKHPLVEVPEIKCVAGQGIHGDRFFGHQPGYKGQITFFAWETFESICHELDIQEKQASAFRRNVVTIGIDLNELIGKEFLMQGLRFRGTEECRPCHWMDEAFANGAHELLKGRGGLRAEILNDGVLRKNFQ